VSAVRSAKRVTLAANVTDRARVSSASPYEATIGFSRAVRVGKMVFVSGTAPVWPDGSCDPDPEVQARRCLEIILAALAQAGARTEDVVRTRMFLTDAKYESAVARAHAAVFRDVRPAATMVVISRMLDPRWKVEIEADAVLD
jgi:enamine deaminase RidA (YjgF/YER057c/UK114 family)